MRERFFALFANCKLTDGQQRSIISDLQRNAYYSIPLALSAILQEVARDRISLEELKSRYSVSEQRTIEEYFSFLLEHELIFLCPYSLLGNFPSISEQFDLPCLISNAIIEIGRLGEEYLIRIAEQLNEMGCEIADVYIYHGLETLEAARLAQIFERQEVFINLFIPNNNNFSEESLLELIDLVPTIKQLVIYNVEGSQCLEPGNSLQIIYSSKDLRDRYFCGAINQELFTPTLLHFTESLHHNTCLNRKISIDTEGNIKNCPSMKESFGNIRDTTLAEAIAKPGFKKYWNITKDQVAVCKDCEFRHICTDCRAYLEDPEDDQSKPLKCGYNPYTCEWGEWSTHPMKQKAIDYYYGMREML